MKILAGLFLFFIREKLCTMIPYDSQSSGFEEGSPSFINNINSVLKVHTKNPDFSIEGLCRELCMCRMQLHRKLKCLTGLSTTHYIRHFRLETAKELLVSTDMNISEVAYEVGFSSPSFFTRCFLEVYEIPPTIFRKKHNPNASDGNETEL